MPQRHCRCSHACWPCRAYALPLTRAQGLDAMLATEPQRCAGHNSGDAFSDFLWSYGWTIADGSNEVMRNLISERFLELPKG